MVTEGFNQQKTEQKRNRMRNALILLQHILKSVENTPDVVDLNGKYEGGALKNLVELYTNKNKDDINLLTAEEQKEINDLLIRAKIYLAYYEKDLINK